MINYTVRLILSLVKPISKLWDDQFNKLVLKRSHTIYKVFPIVNGQLVIRNKGTFLLGDSVKFNCAQKSNVIGLTKTCTLAVGRNAYLEIGDYSGFSGVSIYCSKKIVLGKHVNAGANVSIWDTDFHPLDFEERRIHDESKIASSPICIEDDVFIGANSIILKGVTIGARSIVGAGSVVTRSIPPDQIWAGNPARFIKEHAYETV